MEDLHDVPLAGPIFRAVAEAHHGLEKGRLIGEGVRRLITQMVSDVAAETARRLRHAKPENAAAIRAAPGPMAGFSTALEEDFKTLKAFLFRRMYRHNQVMQAVAQAQKALVELFEAFVSSPGLLPLDWRQACGQSSSRLTARTICDYIAGMTDRYAWQEYRRIFRRDFPV